MIVAPLWSDAQWLSDLMYMTGRMSRSHSLLIHRSSLLTLWGQSSKKVENLPGAIKGRTIERVASTLSVPAGVTVNSSAAGWTRLGDSPGRWERRVSMVAQCRGELGDRGHEWTARKVDLALFQLGETRRRRTAVGPPVGEVPPSMFPMPIPTIGIPARVSCTT